MTSTDFSIEGYRQNVQDRKLRGSRCGNCQTIHLPPHPICVNCRSTNMSWEELSGKGSIVGLTSIAIGLPRMGALGFGRDNPYTTGVVALDEGPGITARIEGEDAEVGALVEADFIEEGDGETTVTLIFKTL